MEYLFKKAQIGLTIVIITIILVLSIGWLVNIGNRECKSNNGCGENEYCGSDFACHQIPIIEKSIVRNNLIMPSVIIGISIVIAALILKSGKLKFRFKKSDKVSDVSSEEKSKLRTP